MISSRTPAELSSDSLMKQALERLVGFEKGHNDSRKMVKLFLFRLFTDNFHGSELCLCSSRWNACSRRRRLLLQCFDRFIAFPLVFFSATDSSDPVGVMMMKAHTVISSLCMPGIHVTGTTGAHPRSLESCLSRHFGRRSTASLVQG